MKLQVLGIDPRAYEVGQLDAPTPLPFVSRRQLKKVKHRLAAPTECHLCESPVYLVRNSVIYGEDYGKWPYAYICGKCTAYVGLHPGTDLPLGTIADRFTRNARKEAKKLFNLHILTTFKKDKAAAYMWLSAALRIPHQRCHFGMFTEQEALESIGKMSTLT